MNTRSWLCASSLNEHLVAKATQVSADIAHFDLEDSVPADRKNDARHALLRHLKKGPAITTAVRINNLTSLDGLRDVLFMAEQQAIPDIVILSKISGPGEITLAASVLKEKKPQVKLFAIIESVKALWEFRGLVTMPEGLSGLIFGSADFATDFGIDLRSADFSFVKHEIALTAKRFGVVAIDSPCFQFRDEERLKQELAQARQLGFSGKIAIHPTQVSIINESFTPSAEAIAEAHRLIDAQEGSNEKSILRMGDEMVGPPFVKHAKNVLSQLK